MATFIPLISSGSAGPLGVLHLPRLWLKASLEANGKLDSRYPGAGQGFDQMTISALGLEREAVLSFIKSSKPSYAQFEAWVKAQLGVKLDAASIAAHNASVLGYNHDDETRKGVLSACGIVDDGKVLDAVHLNDLDSWQELYEAELK
jgi:hypothetical protein